MRGFQVIVVRSSQGGDPPPHLGRSQPARQCSTKGCSNRRGEEEEEEGFTEIVAGGSPRPGSVTGCGSLLPPAVGLHFDEPAMSIRV